MLVLIYKNNLDHLLKLVNLKTYPLYMGKCKL